MKNNTIKTLALLLSILILISGCAPNNINDTPPPEENNSQNTGNIENSTEDAENSTKDAQNNAQDNHEDQTGENQQDQKDDTAIDESGSYTDPYDVAEYIHTYGKLPNNFLTKKEASNLGWKSEEGNLWDVTDEMSIGGDRFGNREGLLPKEEGRIYYECDVNYEGGYRGGERIVFSNDGLIFYTNDHYESFTQLY